jgi:hypothetical protein
MPRPSIVRRSAPRPLQTLPWTHPARHGWRPSARCWWSCPVASRCSVVGKRRVRVAAARTRPDPLAMRAGWSRLTYRDHWRSRSLARRVLIVGSDRADFARTQDRHGSELLFGYSAPGRNRTTRSRPSVSVGASRASEGFSREPNLGRRNPTSRVLRAVYSGISARMSPSKAVRGCAPPGSSPPSKCRHRLTR